MPEETLEQKPIELDRDTYFRSLIRELAGSLEEIIGLKEASGFVSIISQRIGDEINQKYLLALDTEKFDRHQLASVLVDLKRRIGGDFFVIEENEERIIFGNRRCPFGDKVLNRPSMCMMTSNMFGSIAAANLGYAKVELRETIAMGKPGCVVVVHLKSTPQSARAEGREYVKA
ncbi:MAG: methanogen output domain 1-containing protein [Candidatus Binataceae bacterium]